MLERLSLSEVLELLDRIPRGTPLFAVQLETVFLPCKECGAKSGKNGRLTKEFDGIVYTAPCPKCSTQEVRLSKGTIVLFTVTFLRMCAKYVYAFPMGKMRYLMRRMIVQTASFSKPENRQKTLLIPMTSGKGLFSIREDT